MAKRNNCLWLSVLTAGAIVWMVSARADPVGSAIERLDLSVVDAPLPTVSVPGFEQRAARYAITIERALDFFERELGWRIGFRLAVLDRPAWERVSQVPWPAPFVADAEAYIVMPASIAEYPGFDQWPFEDEALSEVLTVHEIGHALGKAKGLASTNHSTHELIADIFMAAFILDQHGSMLSLLDGPPAGFRAERHTQFADLDYLYSGVGLHDYAVYQFELARLARRMLAEKPFRELAPSLAEALQGKEYLMAAKSAQLLASVTPSIRVELQRFMGDSSLPAVEPTPCTGATHEASGEGTPIILENLGDTPLHVIDWAQQDRLQREADGLADLGGEDRKPIPVQPLVVGPGTYYPAFADVGQELDLGGGNCIRVPPTPSRYRNP